MRTGLALAAASTALLAGCTTAGQPVHAAAPHQVPLMRVENGVCGSIGRPPVAGADAEPVGIRGDPDSAVAVWMPGLNDRPCRAQRTVVRRAAARRLADGVLTSPTASGISSCPDDDGSRVQLWFRTGGESDQSVVVDLRGCNSVWAAGRRSRRASQDLMHDLLAVATQPWRHGLRAWLA